MNFLWFINNNYSISNAMNSFLITVYGIFSNFFRVLIKQIHSMILIWFSLLISLSIRTVVTIFNLHSLDLTQNHLLHLSWNFTDIGQMSAFLLFLYHQSRFPLLTGSSFLNNSVPIPSHQGHFDHSEIFFTIFCFLSVIRESFFLFRHEQLTHEECIESHH